MVVTVALALRRGEEGRLEIHTLGLLFGDFAIRWILLPRGDGANVLNLNPDHFGAFLTTSFTQVVQLGLNAELMSMGKMVSWFHQQKYEN